jgi:hypothetical protein
MRNGQNNNKRMRGRNNNNTSSNSNNSSNNHRKSHNPMSRVYESNGPDVKIRGNPSHIAEKYVQLARDAQASGDPVSAENYFQHAEHYLRLIASAQEQFRQNNPHLTRQESDLQSQSARDDQFDDDGDDMGQATGSNDAPFGMREPQPFLPRDAQPFPQQPQQQPQVTPRVHQPSGYENGDDVERLPSFITGGLLPAPQQQQPSQQPPQGNGQNGQNGHDGQAADRFPLHRRRRRHRGTPRQDFQSGAPQGAGGEEREESPQNE